MKVEIFGKKSGSFTDKDTGQLVEYGKLHCVGEFPATDNEAFGKQCMIISCAPRVLSGIPVPCNANLDFNQYGRLAGIEILEG